MRRHFSIEPTPLIVICAAGNASELDFFGTLTQQVAHQIPSAQVRCLAFDCPPSCSSEQWIRHWPGMDLLQLADVVIGGGGYNTVYECAALSVPLVAFSFPRRYDRQHLRIGHYGYGVNTVEEAIAITKTLLEKARSSKKPHPTYLNGVCQAVRYLAQLS